MALRTFDLFSGAGGLARGFHDAGWDVAGAVEMDTDAADSVAASFPASRVVKADVRRLAGRAVVEIAGGPVDAVVGGPPCQGFSINAPVRRAGDERNHLFRQFVDLIRAARPRAVLIENVTGLISMDRGDTFTRPRRRY
jgi:DNA (cytosine-5)-methyltransferase 1